MHTKSDFLHLSTLLSEQTTYMDLLISNFQLSNNLLWFYLNTKIELGKAMLKWIWFWEQLRRAKIKTLALFLKPIHSWLLIPVMLHGFMGWEFLFQLYFWLSNQNSACQVSLELRVTMSWSSVYPYRRTSGFYGIRNYSTIIFTAYLFPSPPQRALNMAVGLLCNCYRRTPNCYDLP